MKCPRCPDTTLTMSDRQGIEIDYCPQCRGVWLDRGELDKLMERATPAAAPVAVSNVRHNDFVDSDYPSGRHGNGGFMKSSRKRSWLHEIFD
jgi:uncharacterized protein